MMPKTITLTGSSGYVGFRLIKRLLEKEYKLKCIARDASYLKQRDFSNNIEIIEADFRNEKNLNLAFENSSIAYYLIHSMTDSERFEDIELNCVNNFVKYAKKHNIKKVIYLGGLYKEDENLSRHMKTRMLIGKILRENLNTTEFRAGIIIGSGSISFEMIRYTAERLPILPVTKYLQSLCQPIGIRDVLSYLIMAIEKQESDSKIIEIAGPDILKYIDMIRIYLKIKNLNKKEFTCPFDNPKICAFIISTLSPIPYTIASNLIESLKNTAIKTNNLAEEIFPEIKPIDYQTQIQYAIRRIVGNEVESIWSTSYIPHYIDITKKFMDYEGLIVQSAKAEILAEKEKIFKTIKSIGGENGYYYANFLWKLRGVIDKLFGGHGIRPRRNIEDIHIGETIDFWRVENLKENELLLLRNELKMPGNGWLKFEITQKDNKNILEITAYFKPDGLLGYIYWYIFYPFHYLIFKNLSIQIKNKSEKNT